MVRATLYFDFVDPLSYLVDLELRDAVRSLATDGTDVVVAYRPFELRPPPAPLISSDDPSLRTRWEEARRAAATLGLTLQPGPLVPWTRKAHELHAFASERDLGSEVRTALFNAFHVGGRDIGRVDVLVDIGRRAGLDETETKAVLDVDRYEPDVRAARGEAETEGVRTTPTLRLDERTLEGFHNRAALGTFLRAP